MSSSRGGGTSAPVFQTFGGSYGDTDYSSSRRLSQQAEGAIGGSSPFATPLEQALLNPQFGARNPAETALLNSAMDLTAGRSAVRGLGPATQASLVSATAPLLNQFYNQNIQNLMGAEGLSQQGKATNLQALMELIGYSMPQIMGGTQSQESSRGVGLFCWVAREVYGANNPKWMKFRHWVINKSPRWFFLVYAKHGERFAKFVSNKPKMKNIIRKWMDNKIEGMSYGIS